MSLPSPSTSGSVPATMDPRLQQQLDAPLIALAQQSGGDLRKLLFAFFSFLHRRTDFYVIPNEEDLKEGLPIKMGFREGDAEKMLLAAFRQFPLRRMPKQGGASNETAKDAAKAKTSESVKVEVTQSKPASKESDKSTVAAESKPTAKAKKDTNETETVRLTEEGKQIPVGNGGTTKRYTWTQTIDEVSLILPVPEGTKGKDLAVDLNPSSISVRMKWKIKGEDEPRTLLEGDLTEKIRTDESTWSLEGGALVVILDKLQKTWWSTVCVGDDEIDTSLIDSRRRIDEYDASTQGAIRKILFDQRQERLGLPTSDEILGKTPTVPPMPPGVEYIDQATLDKHDEESRKGL